MDFLQFGAGTVRYTILALVVVILILVIFLVWKVYSEGFVGTGYANKSVTGVSGALSSGATMRRLSTGFSQPGQGEHDTVYIDEIKEVVPHIVRGESLANRRQEPVFWETGSILDEYRRGEGRYADGAEGLSSGSPVSMMEEGQLASLLAN